VAGTLLVLTEIPVLYSTITADEQVSRLLPGFD